MIEMLDMLEARIASLRANGACAPAGASEAISSDRFREQMGRVGLSSGEFARIFGLDPEVVRDWLAGSAAIPAWAAASLVILAMLSPAARANALNRTSARRPSPGRARGPHPFSRIEEL